MFVWFLNVLVSNRLSHGQVPRLTSDNFMCCHIETEQGDHDFCLSRSHYTDTDPTSGELAQGSNTRPPLPPPSPKFMYRNFISHTQKKNSLSSKKSFLLAKKQVLASLLISLSLGETLLLEPFDGKVYDLLPVFLPELWSCPSNHLCLAPIFWLVFLSLSFRLS